MVGTSRGLHEIHDGRVIYVDMNAFFASVEQHHNPAWRGKALAVVSHNVRRGSVLAASYEAKAFGITTGMRLEEARSRCPGLIVTETKAGRYQTAHRQMMAVLHGLAGNDVKAKSIDEAYLPLPRNWRGSEKARALALTIKERLAQEMGVSFRCSIGIAPNIFLAKVASNLEKPDGLQEIRQDTIISTLASLSLTDLPGIGERNAARLTAHDIATPLDFYHAPADTLARHFGIWGRYWWWRLHGYESDGAKPDEPYKMISHEHVLAKWINRPEELRALVDKMADRLVERLRRQSLQTQRVYLSLKLSGCPSAYFETRFDAPTDTHRHILETLRDMIRPYERLRYPVRKICITFGELRYRSGDQLDLFATVNHQKHLSAAITSIRERHGSGSLRWGSTVSLPTQAGKQEIGFGRIRDR